MKPSQILSKAIELGYYKASGSKYRPIPPGGRDSFMCCAVGNMHEHGLITAKDSSKVRNLIREKIEGWDTLEGYLFELGKPSGRKARTKFYKKWIKKLKAKGK